VQSLTPWLIAATLVGCKACIGCVEPELPDNPDDPVIGDTDSDTGDTADTTTPVDTAPPPPCDVPENEPNDGMDQANAFELEQRACGGFTVEDDGEWLVFPAGDAQWIRVAVDAASMGSAADVTLTVNALESFTNTLLSSTMYWEDPWIVFPALGDSEYHLFLSERSNQYGDDHEWEVLASEDKAPVEWTVDEIEDNNLAERAQTVEAGEVVFGVISEPDDYDWFHIPVPDIGEKISWDVNVEAYTSGSPLASRITLYDADIAGADMDDVDWLATSWSDSAEYDMDPRIEIQSEGATDWYLVIKNPTTSGSGRGSPFHWYTISIQNDAD